MTQPFTSKQSLKITGLVELYRIQIKSLQLPSLEISNLNLTGREKHEIAGIVLSSFPTKVVLQNHQIMDG